MVVVQKLSAAWQHLQKLRQYLPTWPNQRIQLNQLAEKSFRLVIRNTVLQTSCESFARSLLKNCEPGTFDHEEASFWLWRNAGERCPCGSCFTEPLQ